MDIKKFSQYLFFYKHTVCNSIDIEEDISNLYGCLHEYEDMDFKYWLKDNGLDEEYKKFIEFV